MRFWHEWRGSNDGRPSMFIRNLISFRGFKLDLHKFVRADDPTCFHTHPAKAVRLILWGGYREQVRYFRNSSNGNPERYYELKHTWKPGRVGVIYPATCHRIHGLLNGKSSYSIWLRWPKTAEITIYGEC